MHHYPFHPGDYLAATLHLTEAEDLAYRRLLDLAYMSEGPLPADIKQVARRVRMPQEIVEAVLAEFWHRTDDGWRNRRVDEEVQRYQSMRDGGRRGAQKRWAGDAPPIAPLCPPHSPPIPLPIDPLIATKNQEPRTKNQEPEKYISAAGVSKEAWEGFQAIRRARKAPVTVTVLRSLEKQAGLAGMTLDDAMRLCAERGWLTMRADWVAGKQQALEDRNRKIAQEWANG